MTNRKCLRQDGKRPTVSYTLQTTLDGCAALCATDYYCKGIHFNARRMSMDAALRLPD